MNSRFALLALLVLLLACGCRHRPVVDANHPYESEQNAARERVEARGRYDVLHDPNDTMSVNSMGSD